MKPVAIFRHARSDGPGYCATWLGRQGIAHDVIALDAGARVPSDARRFAGLVFMGGPMSVNDDLPWIEPAMALVRDAVAKDVPVLGHCLGGQLMSKAFGGEVTSAPVKEIGWCEVAVQDNAIAHAWLGDRASLTVFQWHGETFSIPPGATRLLSSAHCRNQAFAVGRHLGLQCHVEMTEALVETWCAEGAGEIAAAAASPGVQPPDEIRRDLRERIAALHAVADALYERWSRGLSRA